MVSGDDPSIELAPTGPAVGTARRFVRQALERLGVNAEATDDLVLATDELVTNAVLHARTMFRVTLRRLPQALRVEVFDANPRPPRRRSAPIDATNGRGLGIIEGLGLRWGVVLHPHGKTAWVEHHVPRCGF
jgi:anti-sigma regulatory factor (Ser/Thr protein kinase)